MKAKEEHRYIQLSQQNQLFMDNINDIRSKHKKVDIAWRAESNSLYQELKRTTDIYSNTENEFQLNKQEIRIEIHDDMNLIKDLEDSWAEADVISASLADKAKFSSKLETERQRMIQDRAKLLDDLWVGEKLKYKSKLNTLPSFIEIPHSKNQNVDNVTSKIRHKLFKSNGKMRKQSPDHYTRKESHVQREMRNQARSFYLNSTMKKPLNKSKSFELNAFFRKSIQK
jgi:hypothetical protein